MAHAGQPQPARLPRANLAPEGGFAGAGLDVYIGYGYYRCITCTCITWDIYIIYIYIIIYIYV